MGHAAGGARGTAHRLPAASARLRARGLVPGDRVPEEDPDADGQLPAPGLPAGGPPPDAQSHLPSIPVSQGRPTGGALLPGSALPLQPPPGPQSGLSGLVRASGLVLPERRRGLLD